MQARDVRIGARTVVEARVAVQAASSSGNNSSRVPQQRQQIEQEASQQVPPVPFQPNRLLFTPVFLAERVKMLVRPRTMYTFLADCFPCLVPGIAQYLHTSPFSAKHS